MKKSILALAAGFSLLMSNPANAKDNDFNKVVDTLRDCAYSSYKNQANPSRENASKEQNACSKLEDLKQKKGISSLEDYFSEHGWFYVNGGDYINGKTMNSHFAAKVIKKTEKEGFPVYLTRSGHGVDSFRGFMYNMKYVNTLSYPDGSKKIVIDLEKIEKDAIAVEKAWGGYKSNHSVLLRGDLENWDSSFEPVYLSLKEYKNIRQGYLNEKIKSFTVHESVHAKADHRHNDLNGEKIALSFEVEESPIALYSIQQNASKGDVAEKAVFQCIIGKDSQAKFYLRNKKYIQQRADYCKKQFIRQGQNR